MPGAWVWLPTIPSTWAAAERLPLHLQEVARAAEDALLALQRMRRLVIPPLHILRVQPLERIQRVLPDLRGIPTLEIGAEDGALLLALQERGAPVSGLDIDPRPSPIPMLRGDLMTSRLPGNFGLIVATAVFEHGLGWDEKSGPGLLRRLRSLLTDDGVVVLENIGVPMPFTDADAVRSGLRPIPQVIPSTNPNSGGRGCVLRCC